MLSCRNLPDLFRVSLVYQSCKLAHRLNMDEQDIQDKKESCSSMFLLKHLKTEFAWFTSRGKLQDRLVCDSWN